MKGEGTKPHHRLLLFYKKGCLHCALQTSETVLVEHMKFTKVVHDFYLPLNCDRSCCEVSLAFQGFFFLFGILQGNILLCENVLKLLHSFAGGNLEIVVGENIRVTDL